MSFGETLRELRYARRLTQAQLAERAGLSERAISDLERGLKAPQRATVRLLVDALGLTHDTVELFELAARAHPHSPKHTLDGDARHNLPATLTSFVGREDEIARLQRQLDPSVDDAPAVRLLTLTGAGGCGKTRLAIELARRVAGGFADGMWFVDLSSITDATLVPVVVLTTMGGRESSDQTPLESVLRRVHGKQVFVVLDNCEHLVQSCAELVEALLVATSDLRVLATSREALRVTGETAWRVPSLTVPETLNPPDADRLLEYAAPRLLVDRIRQVQPDFALDASNAAAVAQICSRLDGIPLAIELAAARSVAMSVQDIALRLDDRFSLLTGGRRTALERQRTLRATIDWSHHVLTETERVLFRRLSVFAGGWTLEAAEAVCTDERLPRTEVLDVLMRLVEQSLVNLQLRGGHTRYRFLETVRVYAAEQLQASVEAVVVRRRHCDWCLKFVERAQESLTRTTSSPFASTADDEQVRWFDLVALEYDNVRAALDSCSTNPTWAEVELRLAAAMGQFWWPGKPVEGRRRLAEALERSSAMRSSARASALIWQALFERNFGDGATARALAREAVDAAGAIGDALQRSRGLYTLALATREVDADARMSVLDEALAVARTAGLKGRAAQSLAAKAVALAEAGDSPKARPLLDEARALALDAQDHYVQFLTEMVCGWVAIAEGRLEEADAHFRGVIDRASRSGGAPVPVTLLALGQVCLLRGDLAQSEDLHRRALILVREMEPGGMTMAATLLDTACVEAAAGRAARAQRLLGAHEAWYEAHGGAGRVWRPHTRNGLKRGLVPVPPVPTDPLLMHERAEGRRLSLDEAVAFALKEARDEHSVGPSTV
jgi:non-specific serine/threonine protein kinase